MLLSLPEVAHVREGVSILAAIHSFLICPSSACSAKLAGPASRAVLHAIRKIDRQH
jgi:hypothetical protein